jgi:hypothetical protein
MHGECSIYGTWDEQKMRREFELKETRGKSRYCWYDNAEMDLKDITYMRMWTRVLTQERNQW